MSQRTRRELFGDVGRGMIAAAVGTGLAADLGFAFAADETGHLTFGDLEPLVAFLQETPPDKLLPKVAEKLKSGTDLKTFTAAAALANARAFGGEDYVGFHTLMALAPAYMMAKQETDPERQALPVMKVLVRNSSRLQEVGGPKAEVLKPVQPGKLASDKPAGEQLREITRKGDMAGAEATYAAVCKDAKPQDMLDALLYEVDDATEVHRVVLVSRAYDLINFVGADRAHTLLRQSVRYCVKSEQNANQVKYNQNLRDTLTKVLDQHKLLGSKPGSRSTDDAWVEKFCNRVFAATAEQGAGLVAEALADGIDPEAIGQALSLGANQLLLRDPGRPKQWTGPNKPVGSVHGDSVGLHCSDTIHAWRNLARAGDRRTQVTSLILAGYQVARDRSQYRQPDVAGDMLKWEPHPTAEAREAVKGVAADSLMKELDAAIRDRNQARAAALAGRIGETNPDGSKEVFALLRGFAVADDGALHAEKYYATTSDEFAAARPAFKWRQLVALARVSASAFGYPAPGHEEACKLLKKA
jgi:hypothetical protein